MDAAIAVARSASTASVGRKYHAVLVSTRLGALKIIY